jgi:hypothetical protein
MLVQGLNARAVLRGGLFLLGLLVMRAPNAKAQSPYLYRGMYAGMTGAALRSLLKPTAERLDCDPDKVKILHCVAASPTLRGAVFVEIAWEETPEGRAYFIRATRPLPAGRAPRDTSKAFVFEEALRLQWGDPAEETGLTYYVHSLWKTARFAALAEQGTPHGDDRPEVFIVSLWDRPVASEMASRVEAAAIRARTKGIEP